MALIMESPRVLEKRETPAVAGRLTAWTVLAAVLVVMAIVAVAASSPPPLDPAMMSLIGP